MARALRPGATVLLSGILVREAPGVAAAYGWAGFAIVDHRRIEGWSTIVLRRR
jgi:ribosomal protein L11 methyltransferase